MNPSMIHSASDGSWCSPGGLVFVFTVSAVLALCRLPTSQHRSGSSSFMVNSSVAREHTGLLWPGPRELTPQRVERTERGPVPLLARSQGHTSTFTELNVEGWYWWGGQTLQLCITVFNFPLSGPGLSLLRPIAMLSTYSMYLRDSKPLSRLRC